MTAETVGKTTKITLTIGSIVAAIVVVFLAGGWADNMSVNLGHVSKAVEKISKDINAMKAANIETNQDMRDRVTRLETQMQQVLDQLRKMFDDGKGMDK